jgi:hypothetical protein
MSSTGKLLIETETIRRLAKQCREKETMRNTEK